MTGTVPRSVWTSAELRAISAALLATVDSATASMPDTHAAQAYRAGYRAAMAGLLVAIGAQPLPAPVQPQREDYGDTPLSGGGTLAGGYGGGY